VPSGPTLWLSVFVRMHVTSNTSIPTPPIADSQKIAIQPSEWKGAPPLPSSSVEARRQG
jgi:hypothetical protein